MLLWWRRQGSKAGMLDLTAAGRGWGHGWELQAGLKTAMLLLWLVLSRWAAWLEPPTLLLGQMRDFTAGNSLPASS